MSWSTFTIFYLEGTNIGTVKIGDRCKIAFATVHGPCEIGDDSVIGGRAVIHKSKTIQIEQFGEN